MTLRTPREIWVDSCRATADIQAQYGPDAAIDYLVGDKLMAFAQMGDTHPEFLGELPAFSARIRELFNREDIEAHFARADDASRVEPDLLKFATPDEVEAMKEGFEEDRRARERRDWVKAMLLRSAS
jgi:hypothetical protein